MASQTVRGYCAAAAAAPPFDVSLALKGFVQWPAALGLGALVATSAALYDEVRIIPKFERQEAFNKQQEAFNKQQEAFNKQQEAFNKEVSDKLDQLLKKI